jgi:DNA-binding transcriptional LysR family regulator
MIVSSHELYYFIELAKTLNFSRTAERIGISQPSLSAAIKRLEHSLGVDLFIRSKHHVSLTHAGKKFLLHAIELQQLWDNTKTVCLAAHEEVQGQVVLGCHSSVAMYSLPKFLPSLLKKYPKLELQLKHDLSRKIAEEVISLTIDIGIAVNPIKNPNLIIKKLFEDEFAFWCAAKKSHTGLESLTQEATLIGDPDLLQTQYLLKKLHKIGIKTYRMITSSNLETIARLTAAGAGIGILPGLVVQSIVPGQLKKLAKTPSYHDEICLVYRHENRNVKAIKVIGEAIKTLMAP